MRGYIEGPVARTAGGEAGVLFKTLRKRFPETVPKIFGENALRCFPALKPTT